VAEQRIDVVVIGGGQSGLAVGYYLRRTGLTYVILDNQREPGGSWLHAWKSLRLFSPAQWSSLPGMIMRGGTDSYPSLGEALEYLGLYESKYELPVKRPVTVLRVVKAGEGFRVETTDGNYQCRALVSATGSFMNPYVPKVAGWESFSGEILHSSRYDVAERFAGKRVAIVGEGNSGAQILAEVSRVADTLWITQREPRFLPDHVDGRFLFDAATQLYEAQKQGKAYVPPSLGDIVMVDSVKEARGRGVLKSVRAFERFSENSLVWADGREEKVDAVIFCTGFRNSLQHLAGLQVINAEGKVDTEGTRATSISGLWLVGYGNWTGFASATLIGVGRTAKATVEQVKAFLGVTLEG
jgi:putative flavoprotein involved in K+ transport